MISRDSMYRRVTIVNSIVIYMKVAKNKSLKFYTHTHTHTHMCIKGNCEAMDVLANFIIIIILKYTQISNHHMYTLNLYNMSVIS